MNEREELTLVGFGVVVRAQVPSPIAGRFTQAVAHCLSRGADAQGAAEVSLVVQGNAERGFNAELNGERVPEVSPAQLPVELAARLESFIAEHSTTHIFVHAGVVCCGEWALVLPGRSHAGKSTLVEALVRAGASYWSDEFAPVTPDGRIVAFPRPLNRRCMAGIERVDMRVPTDAQARCVDRVIFTHYKPEASYTPRALSKGEALLRLLEQTVPARQRPAEAMEAFDRLLTTADVETGARGDAEEFAEALLTSV